MSFKCKRKTDFSTIKGESHLVIGGAGTGKSTIIKHKIQKLLSEGVKPSKILYLTQNYQDINKELDLIHENTKLLSWTFKSFVYELVRGDPYPSNPALVSETFNDIQKKDDDLALGSIDLHDRLRTLWEKINSSLNKDGSNKKIIEQTRSQYKKLFDQIVCRTDIIEKISNVLSKVEVCLSQQNLESVGSKMKKMHELFSQSPEKIPQYEWIFVDELESISEMQFEILKHLYPKTPNIFCAIDVHGDISFDRVSVENIIEKYTQHFKPQIQKLTYNYRIKKNVLSKIKECDIFHQHLSLSATSGGEVHFQLLKDKNEEKKWIKNILEDLLQKKQTCMILTTLKYKKYLKSYESFLNIPISHCEPNWQEQLFILTLLHLYDVNVDNTVKSNVRWQHYNTWSAWWGNKYHIPQEEQEIINKHAQKVKQNNYKIFNSLSNIQGLSPKTIESGIVFWKTIHKIKSISMSSKNMWKFMECVFDALGHGQKWKNLKFEINEWVFTMDQTLKVNNLKKTIQMNYKALNKPSIEPIQHNTFCRSKGLEWDNVMVLGVTNGFIPCIYAPGFKHAIDHDRRLLYIALTRSKERLFVGCGGKKFKMPKQLKGEKAPKGPSVFVEKLL